MTGPAIRPTVNAVTCSDAFSNPLCCQEGIRGLAGAAAKLFPWRGWGVGFEAPPVA